MRPTNFDYAEYWRLRRRGHIAAACRIVTRCYSFDDIAALLGRRYVEGA